MSEVYDKIARFALFAIIVVVLVVLEHVVSRRVARWTGNRHHHKLDASSGTIRPSRFGAVAVIGIGLIIFLFGLLVVFWKESIRGLLFVVFGVACFAISWLSLNRTYDVTWDKDGVEGPCQRFAFALGWKRRRLQWRELKRLGTTGNEQHFVEASDNRCIYWTASHRGHTHFSEVVREKRPDIKD